MGANEHTCTSIYACVIIIHLYEYFYVHTNPWATINEKRRTTSCAHLFKHVNVYIHMYKDTIYMHVLCVNIYCSKYTSCEYLCLHMPIYSWLLIPTCVFVCVPTHTYIYIHMCVFVYVSIHTY